MKCLFSYLLLFLLPACCLAQQETIIRKNRLTNNVKEEISVLKADKNIRQGIYKALMDGNRALAIGQYTNNVKTGTWNFFDLGNHLIQRFDYTNQKLLYEAPEDTTSNCRYVVDRVVKDSDLTTKPVIRGGRYYGYINYMKLFRLPKDLQGIDGRTVLTSIEILVSPGGRLADYVVHLVGPQLDRKIGFNTDLLSAEDKTFIPATINSEPIACRIFVRCFITDDGQLLLY